MPLILIFPARGNLIPEIIAIHVNRLNALAHITFAGGTRGLFLGRGKYRQQQTRQNGNDGDDHQQFDQSECAKGNLSSVKNAMKRVALTSSKHFFGSTLSP